MLFLLFSYFLVSAKEVSTRELKPKQILEVYLSLGKTTLLRFEEKPQKIIIGNKNYFNLETTDNDIALQPLSRATTNLFVYLKDQTYSFILKTCDACNYDDFIIVKKKQDSVEEIVITKKPLNLQKKISKLIQFKNISVYFEDIERFDKKRLMRFEIGNMSKKSVQASEIEFQLFDLRGAINSEHAFESFYLDPGKTRGRLVFSLKDLTNVTLRITIGKETKTLQLERRILY